MSVQLAPQAQERLGTSALGRITERVDDVALLIGQMGTRGVPEVLARPIPRHGSQRGLSWGGTVVMWLASIVTEGDHRTVSVDTYRKGLRHPLRRLTAQGIAPRDWRDERLRHLRTHVRKPASWHPIAHALQARSMEGDPLPQDGLRCAATTVSGTHEGTEEGLGQFGHSKDEPTRPQRKVMIGSLAPWGRPRATAVGAGERAEDGLYLPSIARLRTGWPTTGRLLVGAGTRRALAPRASLARHRDGSLAPWPGPGATAEAMEAWITPGVRTGEAGEGGRRGRTKDRGHEVRAAEGSEMERTWGAPDSDVAWRERVGVVRAPLQANHPAAGLAKRLPQAETALAALPPPEAGGDGKAPTKRRAWRRWLVCCQTSGWTGGTACPGQSRSSRPPTT